MDSAVVTDPETGTNVSLARLRQGERGVVLSVIDDGESLGDARISTIGRRLLELGFVPGAEVEIIATMWPGADPLAVRVGATTFALRRREAAAVRVRPATRAELEVAAT